MRLTESKKALAAAIHASGKGWPGGADSAVQDKDMWVCIYEGKPTRHGEAWQDDGDCLYKLGFAYDKLLPNWHQTILSRDEYFSAYPEKVEPVADADGWIEFDGIECPVESSMLVDFLGLKNCYMGSKYPASLVEWSKVTSYRISSDQEKGHFHDLIGGGAPVAEVAQKPTIEQLTADYRNKLDYANRKQQEADDAKAAADAALGELVSAGEALGLVIGIATPEPELVITDWRVLLERDVIWFGGDDEQAAGEYSVLEVESPDYGGNRAIRIDIIGDSYWIDVTDDWKFIRRP